MILIKVLPDLNLMKRPLKGDSDTYCICHLDFLSLGILLHQLSNSAMIPSKLKPHLQTHKHNILFVCLIILRNFDEEDHEGVRLSSRSYLVVELVKSKKPHTLIFPACKAIMNKMTGFTLSEYNNNSL